MCLGALTYQYVAESGTRVMTSCRIRPSRGGKATSPPVSTRPGHRTAQGRRFPGGPADCQEDPRYTPRRSRLFRNMCKILTMFAAESPPCTLNLTAGSRAGCQQGHVSGLSCKARSTRLGYTHAYTYTHIHIHTHTHMHMHTHRVHDVANECDQTTLSLRRQPLAFPSAEPLELAVPSMRRPQRRPSLSPHQR